MVSQQDLNDDEFESEVIKLARNLWPNDIDGGSYIVDDRERDGIFITEDTVHLIECTTSRTKEKAEKDVDKLSALAKKYQQNFPDKAVKGWFITKNEPTPDQRTVVKSKGYLVTGISFERFQARLIDVATYLSCRGNYAFGSVRDPGTGEAVFADDYIDIDLVDKRNSSLWSIEDISSKLLNNDIVLVQGHFGVGKSMCLKQVYKTIARKYSEKSIVRFPLYINLRDHHGQTDPVEVIERHSRKIGFRNPEHLVRAWRAGYVILILDGFDEIAALGWAGKTSTLKDIRYKSMEILREFIRQSKGRTGVLIAGRSNYFDSIIECQKALGLGANMPFLSIGDFTQNQVEQYLTKKGMQTEIPDWLPTRPLLLGYLVAKNILIELDGKLSADSPAEGWNILIDAICERESIIESGLTADTIREIIEGVACVARKFQNGLGPIYQADLERVFNEKVGYLPDDRGLVLLQRLPGVASHDQQDGSRYFIDEFFADILKAGEVYQFVCNPYQFRFSIDPRQWVESIDVLGVDLLSTKVSVLPSNQLEEAIVFAKRQGFEILAVDLLMSLNFLGRSWSREQITFSDVLVPSFEIKPEVDLSRITFNSVIFKLLYVYEIPGKNNAPLLQGCIIGMLVGYSDKNAFPDYFIDSQTMIEDVERQSLTTAALLELDLPTSVKVGLTIIKKLYLQAGGGRQENSFYRGLSPNEKAYVPSVLNLFKHEGVALPSNKSGSNKVWQPVKKYYGKMTNIISNKTYNDPIISKLKEIVV